MAYAYSNEPYNRVTREDGIVNGTLIGAGLAAAGSGATVLGAKMSYNRIEGKTNRSIDNLKAQQQSFDKRVQKYSDRLDNFNSQEMDGSLNRRNAKKADRAYKGFEKYTGKSEQAGSNLEELTHKDYLKNKKSSHLYGRNMGGWKNAAIIGASSVIGAGLGMVTDAIDN